MMRWVEANEVSLLRVPAYHHRGNGIIERYNRNLITRIRYLLFENQDSWTDHVQRAAQQIRGMVHKSLGKTPEEIVQRPLRNGSKQLLNM